MKNLPANYEAPSIEVFELRLEQGIANSSATISGGDEGNLHQPDIEDWTDGGIETTWGDI